MNFRPTSNKSAGSLTPATAILLPMRLEDGGFTPNWYDVCAAVCLVGNLVKVLASRLRFGVSLEVTKSHSSP